MKQTQKQQTKNQPIDMTFSFPKKIGQEIKEQADSNKFMVRAAKKALLEQWQDEKTKISLAQIEAGEVVSHEKVEKWLISWGTKNKLPMPKCK